MVRASCVDSGGHYTNAVYAYAKRNAGRRVFAIKGVGGEGKAMVNVGSVGQPRDGDPRACYVILDDDLVQFRRIEYPFEETIAKIYDVPESDNFLGDRLRDGR